MLDSCRRARPGAANSALRVALLLLASSHLAGCAAVSGYPRPAFSARDEEAELKAFAKAGSIETFEQCADKVVCRNAIVDARLRATDLAFFRFQRQIYRQESRMALGTGMLSMAVNSIAAVTGTGPLAAGATLLTGGRDVYQKQAMSVSLPLLMQEMSVARREVLYRIKVGQTMPMAAYSLVDALSDVTDYEQAGSIPAAAARLTANGTWKARDAEERLTKLRANTFATVTAAAAAPLSVALAPPAVIAAAPPTATAITPNPSSPPLPTAAPGAREPSTNGRSAPGATPVSTGGSGKPLPVTPGSSASPTPPHTMF
jgi:hypothetical protein